jgi:hypothetical protein
LVDREEKIQWWDAQDALINACRAGYCLDKEMETLRECRHPDAQWLASLFPRGVSVNRADLREVLLELDDDPRAVYMTWLFCEDATTLPALVAAAERGYARAQAELSKQCEEYEDTFKWAEKAGLQFDREGLYKLGDCYYYGRGCARDKERGIELIRQAAELQLAAAQYCYGLLAFGEADWERFLWWGRAALRGRELFMFYAALVGVRRSFERGELGRILHTVAPVTRRLFDAKAKERYGDFFDDSDVAYFELLSALHRAMLGRARAAIHCWSAVALRLGVVKDIRVMIAKMAWEEPWRWSEKRAETNEKTGGK